MTQFTLRYNSENQTTALDRDGDSLTLSCLGTGEGHSIDEWKGAFFNELAKKCNWGPGIERKIVFFGDDGSYTAFESEMQRYTDRNPGIKLELEKGEDKVETVLKCKNCGAELKPNWKICPECETPTGTPKCANCGAELEPKWKLCPECGTPVGEAKPPEAEGSAAEPEPEQNSDDELEELTNRANDFMEEGEYASAIAEYTKALHIAPDDAALYYLRGSAYEEKGNYKKALADLSKAIEIAPSCNNYFARAMVYRELENDDAALADLTAAIKIGPESDDDDGYLSLAYTHRGWLYSKLLKEDKAISDFTKAIKLDTQWYLFRDRGIAYILIGEYNSALKDFNKAIELYNEEPEIDDKVLADIYLARAATYGNLHKLEKQEADYKTVLRLDPDNEVAQKWFEEWEDPDYDEDDEDEDFDDDDFDDDDFDDDDDDDD